MSESSATNTFSFAPAGGEMGRLVRGLDWSSTPLGSPSEWSAALRSSLSICLGSRFPIALYWGPRLTLLYNDAWSPIPGSKHPWALGRDAREVWPEIWDTIGPLFEEVMGTGESTYSEDSLLLMARHGYVEECYFNYTFTPVRGEGGEVDGVFNAVIETTYRVISERRTHVLRMLADRLAGAESAAHVCARAVESLATAQHDAPFCAMYFEGHDGVRLVSVTGASAGSPAAPEVIERHDGAPCWPVFEALSTDRSVHVKSLDPRVGSLPGGAWPEPCREAIVVPFGAVGDRRAVLVLGASPRRAVDADYLAFAERIAAHVTAALSNALALETERTRSERLAEIDRAKTVFFSNVSHELRTPLTLLLAPLEEASTSPTIPAAERAPLVIAHRNAVRLLKLVNGLLDFSRIEAGRAHAAHEPVDLAAFTRELASAFEAPMDRAGLRYVVRCEEIGEPVHVDRTMWEKIVFNLLSNAFKFTLEGQVEVSLARVSAFARLVVRDTGVGVPEHELPRLFERFHRVESTQGRTHEGSGIGLSLVHELVKLHGGSLRVESELGRGTAFAVDVPLGTAHVASTTTPSAPPPSTAVREASYVAEALSWLPGSTSSPGLELTAAPRILVADDNPDMREYVRRLLAERWQVETVGDGAAALEAIRRTRPDLVVADVMMPVLDGFAMVAALRDDEATRDLPVLMLSARAGEEARSEGIEAGADDYLVKPFAARELVARVQQLLSSASAREKDRAHRKFLEALLAQAPVAIAVWRGPDHVFELANERYERMIGRRDVAGKTFRDVFHEAESAATVDILDRVYETGVPFHDPEYEIWFDRAAHTGRDQRWFAVTMAPLHEGDAISALITAAVDVTDQVVARRRMDDLRKAAVDASRAKDEFLSVLSHELRTPLNAIIGWSNMLRAGTVRPEQTAKALETVERNARMQARLIEDMLDLSRIEQGKLVLSVGPLEMVRVVEAALDAVRPAADAKGIRLQPVLDSHATIVGDPDRLQQIVWNLLSNAIKFTPRGGRVQVRVQREPSYVELAVADTGQGIDPSFLPHVFDRFRQADPSSTRQAGGLGLGLAIVRSLVELHGGLITAHSDGLDAGATFVVRIPMAPLRADQAPPARLEPEPFGPTAFECPPALAGKSVLVVDDEHETRELLQFVISQCDCRVETAASAAEALVALEQGEFDLMVSDVGMPEMDGIELIGRVRSLPLRGRGGIPAIALTAYARPEDRTRALRAGFDMHLSKPVDPGELLAVLAAVLAGRERR